jgi:hypothetical protein
MNNTTSHSHSIVELLAVVHRLPATTPQAGGLPVGGRYKAFQEQWIGWLEEYDGPGYYARKDGKRDARWDYQHLNNGKMIVWLSKAAGESAHSIGAAIEEMMRSGPIPRVKRRSLVCICLGIEPLGCSSGEGRVCRRAGRQWTYERATCRRRCAF